jgi:hypothetical protein
MFYCSIYLGAGKIRILTSNQWDKLRQDVAAILKKQPDLKWGALRDDDGMYIRRFRKGMSGFPKTQPTEYLPMKDLFKRPPK